MPSMSESMEEGTILKWLVGVGDRLDAGDPMVEIETDKSNVTHESDRSGVVAELLVDEGELVAVGTPIARLAGEAAANQGAGTSGGTSGGTGDALAAAPAGSDPASAAAAARPEPTDLSTEAASSVKGEPMVVEPTRVQSAAARRVSESRATVPEICLRIDVDMTACVELRERLCTVADPPPTLNDFIVKAAAVALREHPRVNAAYRDGRFESYDRVNVGIGVAAARTVVTPTLRDADRHSLGEIARRTRELVARARRGSLAPPELSGATFTISNLGVLGIESFDPIVMPPQAAALGLGAARPRPVVDDHGRIVVRRTMTASLACDGRILDPAEAAAFLTRVRELLENTAGMAL